MAISKIIKLSTSWCNPCKMLKKNLEGFTRVPVEEVDCEENPDIAEKYNVRNVPTLIYLNDKDEVIDRTVGLQTIDQINAIIDKHETD